MLRHAKLRFSGLQSAICRGVISVPMLMLANAGADGSVVQPEIGQPGKDGVLPGQPLVVVHDDMVLAVHLDIADGPSQYAQGREELLALVGRHVRVRRAVEEEERRVDLVSLEEW